MFNIKGVVLVLAIHGLIDCHPKAQFLTAPSPNAPQTYFAAPPPGPVRPGLPRPPVSLFGRPAPSPFVPGPSVSGVKSEALSKQVDIGDLSLTGSKTNTNTFTQTDNGFNAGRTDSISKGVNLGKLDVSSTLTREKEINNGKLSSDYRHNLEVGNVDVESSLSRDNIKKGFGLVKDQNGEVSLNLGLLNIDLTKDNVPVKGTGTTANVNAVGQGAQTQSNSEINVDKKNYGLIDVTNTHSTSNAIGSVENGYTNANGGAFANRAISNRNTLFKGPLGLFGRAKREIRQKRQFQFPGQFGGFNQNSAANTGSNNFRNQFGSFQQNTGNAISSNLANDGSRGQLSAANTAQNSFQMGNVFGNMNAAQGQATNFGPNGQLDLANAQANNIFQKGPDGIRQENTSGANSLTQNQFGSASNIANTKTESIRGPNGQVINSSSSSASSSSVNNGKGGNISSNANANSGNVNGQSFGNAAGNANIYQPGFGGFGGFRG